MQAQLQHLLHLAWKRILLSHLFLQNRRHLEIAEHFVNARSILQLTVVAILNIVVCAKSQNLLTGKLFIIQTRLQAVLMWHALPRARDALNQNAQNAPNHFLKGQPADLIAIYFHPHSHLMHQ